MYRLHTPAGQLLTRYNCHSRRPALETPLSEPSQIRNLEDKQHPTDHNTTNSRVTHVAGGSILLWFRGLLQL